MQHPSSPRQLRRARRAVGWDITRLACELRRADDQASASTESLARMIRDWESGRHRPTERYRLLLERVLAPSLPSAGSAAERVRATTRHLLALDERHGAAGLLTTALAAVRTAVTEAARGDRDVLAAASQAQQVAGWLAHDAAQPQLARRMTLEALASARQAEDPGSELSAFSQLAMVDVQAGRIEDVRRVCEPALARRVPPRVAALFALRRARAEAQAGNIAQARQLLARARRQCEEEEPEADPPWAWWVTPAEIDWHHAQAEADQGRWPKAADRFAAAFEGRPFGYDRGRVNDAAWWALALTRLAAWRNAEDVLERHIAPYTPAIHSPRTTHVLRQLASHARHAGARGLADTADTADMRTASLTDEKAPRDRPGGG